MAVPRRSDARRSDARRSDARWYDLERLRRPDWLGELQGLVTVILVVLSMAGMLSVISVLAGGAVVAEVPTEAVTEAVIGPAGETGGLAPGVRVDDAGAVAVTVDDPSAAQLVAYNLTQLPTYLVVATVLVMLRGLLRRARRENPFRLATIRRLRILALVAFTGGALAEIIEILAALDLSARLTADAVMTTTLSLEPMGVWLLVGSGFFAIAELVKRGLAMRTELDAVI